MALTVVNLVNMHVDKIVPPAIDAYLDTGDLAGMGALGNFEVGLAVESATPRMDADIIKSFNHYNVSEAGLGRLGVSLCTRLPGHI